LISDGITVHTDAMEATSVDEESCGGSIPCTLHLVVPTSCIRRIRPSAKQDGASFLSMPRCLNTVDSAKVEAGLWLTKFKDMLKNFFYKVFLQR
jgi:hypothetical protein